MIRGYEQNSREIIAPEICFWYDSYFVKEIWKRNFTDKSRSHLLTNPVWTLLFVKLDGLSSHSVPSSKISQSYLLCVFCLRY